MSNKESPSVNPLHALYIELHRYGQNSEFEKAIKVANKILRQSPEDQKIFHYKLVCQIQLGKFDDALQQMHKNPKLTRNLDFEKAYCQYRLNRTEEALKTLQEIGKLDERCQELLGQVLYRLEQFQDSYEVYRKLVKNVQDDFEDEREANLSAAYATIKGGDQNTVDALINNTRTYELCYNAACWLLDQGDYLAALEKLKLSEKLCREMFADDPDVTPEEVDEELAILRVQMGYANQMLNKKEEAMSLYNQALKNKLTDIALTAVCSNNIVTLNKDQNVFDSKKKIKAATVNGLNHKLTSAQKKSIAINQCILYMYTNQKEMCRTSIQSLKKAYPDSDIPIMVEVSQMCQEKQISKAIEHLVSSSKNNADTLKQLTLAQLYLNQGDITSACDALQSLSDIRHKLGVISTLMTLYINQEDYNMVSKVLNESIVWYEKNQQKSDDLQILRKINADFQMMHGDPKVAARMLESVRKSDPQDMKTLAQLIASYSKFDANQAQIISRELPSINQIAQDVDVTHLESSVNTLVPRYIKKSKVDSSPHIKSPRSGELPIMKRTKRKKKKGKLPKNISADSVIDPERWIPRRERSYYRGKRKDKKKDIGKGTQGAASSPELDASGKSPSQPQSTSPTVSPPTSAPPGAGPRLQKPSSKQQKKKKKGGSKW